MMFSISYNLLAQKSISMKNCLNKKYILGLQSPQMTEFDFFDDQLFFMTKINEKCPYFS